MYTSNVRDIVIGMTMHEQLRMIRNIIEDEEFKLEQKKKKEEKLRKRVKMAEDNERREKRESSPIKPLEEMTYEELVD